MYGNIIYSDKEIDAFYILTPHIIERIKLLSSKINGDIILSFIDNKLYIGINNKRNLYEIEISADTNIKQVKNTSL